MFTGFTVIDNRTGHEPDYEKIALTEDWAKHLIYCDVEGFALTENGSIVLLDECGNYVYVPENRFRVVFDNNCSEKSFTNDSFDQISFDQLVVPKKELKHVDLYVHGSCPKNPGDGAWCAVLKAGAHEKIVTGIVENTTSYQSELFAIEGGLQALIQPASVTVYTRMQPIVQHFSGINTKEDVLKALEFCKRSIRLNNSRQYANVTKQYLIHDIDFVWIGKNKYDPSLQKSIDTSKRLANEFVSNKTKETQLIA